MEVRRKRGGVGCGGAGGLRMAGIVMTTIEITAGRILIRQVMYIYLAHECSNVDHDALSEH